MNQGANQVGYEHGYIFDEKRKIIHNKRNLTEYQFDLYFLNKSKRQRPDLQDFDYITFKNKYVAGEKYFNCLKRHLNKEFGRLALYGNDSRRYEYLKIYEDQIAALSQPHIQSFKYGVERTWEDTSKVVAYMDGVISRIRRYGLNYPLATNIKTKTEYDNSRDKLTNYFLREMKKPPRQSKSSSDDE